MVRWNLSSHFFQDMKESVLESALGSVIDDELVTAMLLDYIRKGLCTDEIRGNCLARLLRNIYLHQVDVEARKLGEFWEKDSTNSSEPGERKSEFVLIRYVRTGDEILAGIAGHHELAVAFRDDITDFLPSIWVCKVEDCQRRITSRVIRSCSTTLFCIRWSITWKSKAGGGKLRSQVRGGCERIGFFSPIESLA
mmetsp:Transcript_20787/g.30196  ORF Transcript_20787/g.30196 Transcript_20787/m.30196 type:complete len:195 (-) Transcript_20787:1410-1994(-)